MNPFIEQGAKIADLAIKVQILREALAPFSRITVEGQDHTEFAEQYPDLAAKVAAAKVAMDLTRISLK